MAHYKVQTPDGQTITLEGPDGATDAQVIAQAQALYKAPAARRDVPSNTGIGFIDRSNDKRMADYRATQARAKVQNAAPGKPAGEQFAEDAKAPFIAALSNLKGAWADAMGATTYDPKSTSRILGSAAAVPLSVLSGLTDAAIAKPAARALRKAGIGDDVSNASGINMALMALAPGKTIPASVPRVAVGAASKMPMGALPEALRVVVPKAADRQAMAATAERYRAAGLKPTLADVVDDSGRGVLSAAATRQTPARQAANDFQRNRAADLPSQMSRQARTSISADARTPDQIREVLAEQRTTQAQQGMAEIGDHLVKLDDNSIIALRSDLASSAIEDAAKNALASAKPEVRNAGAALRDIRQRLLDHPNGTTIRVRDAQDISRALNEAASSAYTGGNGGRGGALKDLAKAIRENARTPEQGGFGEYDAWLKQYEEAKGLENAVGIGEQFMTRNTDEFTAGMAGLSADERALAQAAARRAVERKSGENLGAAPGVARQIAGAPEQQARNAALLGPEGAADLQNRMALSERMVDNANATAPRMGSRTAVLGQDQQTLANGIQTGVQALGKGFRGDFIGIGLDWLKTRGMNDQAAQQIVEMAIDPNRLDEALNILEQMYGPRASRDFLTHIVRQAPQAAGASLAGSTGLSTMQPGPGTPQ